MHVLPEILPRLFLIWACFKHSCKKILDSTYSHRCIYATIMFSLSCSFYHLYLYPVSRRVSHVLCIINQQTCYCNRLSSPVTYIKQKQKFHFTLQMKTVSCMWCQTIQPYENLKNIHIRMTVYLALVHTLFFYTQMRLYSSNLSALIWSTEHVLPVMTNITNH